MIKLDTLTYGDLLEIKDWRNDCIQSLRTPGLTTNMQQGEFYKNVICNKNSNLKYFGLKYDASFAVSKWELIGCTGLEIQWENRLAEISLLIDPKHQKSGYGTMALELILKYGFDSLNLENIYGEVYDCNPAIDFWYKFIKKYDGYKVILPMRKFYNGKYCNSLYFNIGVKSWRYKNVD